MVPLAEFGDELPERLSGIAGLHVGNGLADGLHVRAQLLGGGMLDTPQLEALFRGQGRAAVGKLLGEETVEGFKLMGGVGGHGQIPDGVTQLQDTSRRHPGQKRRKSVLEAYRPVYNAVRSPEALGDEPPVARWRPSPRRRPDRVSEASYPPGAVVRRVCETGSIRYRRARIMVGRGMAGEPVRVEERTGSVEVYYCDYRIRCLSEAALERDTML